MIFSGMIVALLVLGAVLWFLLDRHETRRAASGLPRHSGLRLIFVSAALLLMLFSGGCGLLFLANQDGQYVTWQSVGIIAGPPFALGLAVYWLAGARSRSLASGVVGLVVLFAAVFAGAMLWWMAFIGTPRPIPSLGVAGAITALAAVLWSLKARGRPD